MCWCQLQGVGTSYNVLVPITRCWYQLQCAGAISCKVKCQYSCNSLKQEMSLLASGVSVWVKSMVKSLTRVTSDILVG